MSFSQTSVDEAAITAAPSMQSGVRFRAYPSLALKRTLAQWIGCQRVIYNAKTEEDRMFSSQRRLILRDEPDASVTTPLDRAYSQFKNNSLTPWLSDVPSQILRNGSDRWMDAKQRQLKGLARAPSRRNRGNFNSVLISSELFRFYEWVDIDGVFHAALELGTYANPVGALDFHAHREFALLKQITVRNTNGHWWLSFSYEHAAPSSAMSGAFGHRDEAELAYELNLLSDEALRAVSLGIDRNVKDNCIATSDGRFFGLSEVQKVRLARKTAGAKRLQRRMARQVKGSRNRAKTRTRLAAKHEYRGNVARDFSHQTSNSLVSKPMQRSIEPEASGPSARPKLLTFEALKIKSMTARPKAKQDEHGKWLSNRAAQKAGLNVSILSSCWGAIAEQTTYKAKRSDALVLMAPAHYSSQECSSCRHTHPDNRHEQRFVCQRCGLTLHADTNASINMENRGIAMVRDDKVVVKIKKRVAYKRRLSKENAGRESPGVSVEGRVRQGKAKAKSLQHPTKQKNLGGNQDAPTRAPPGV